MVVDDEIAHGHGHRQHVCVGGNVSSYLTPSILITRTFRSVGINGAKYLRARLAAGPQEEGQEADHGSAHGEFPCRRMKLSSSV
jgi:hypothetical protein